MGEGVGEALEVETWFPSKGLVTYYREGRGGVQNGSGGGGGGM